MLFPKYNNHVQRYQTHSPQNPQSPLKDHSPQFERYSKYKVKPINLSPNQSNSPRLQHSLIYKLGAMKRSDLGWDGVKLKEYVTEKISQDYLQNQKMLQRFRRQGQQNRKNKKHAHTKSIDKYRQYEQTHAPTFPKIQRFKTQNVQPDIPEEESTQQIVYHNVGINTNLLPKKLPNEKYLNMKNRYKKMKDKYKVEISRRKDIHKMHLHRLQDQIEDISVQLQNTNNTIREKLSEEEKKNRKMKLLEERVQILQSLSKDQLKQIQEIKKKASVQKKRKATIQRQEQEEDSYDFEFERKPKVVYNFKKTFKNMHFKQNPHAFS